MIEAYTHEKHYHVLRKWLAAHDMQLPAKEYLSDIGLCVDDKAIGFLLTTNSKVAFLDSFAADPEATASERDSAIRTLTDALIEIAMRKGARLVEWYTCLETMKTRFNRMGFKRFADNYVIYYKFIPGGI